MLGFASWQIHNFLIESSCTWIWIWAVSIVFAYIIHLLIAPRMAWLWRSVIKAPFLLNSSALWRLFYETQLFIVLYNSNSKFIADYYRGNAPVTCPPDQLSWPTPSKIAQPSKSATVHLVLSIVSCLSRCLTPAVPNVRLGTFISSFQADQQRFCPYTFLLLFASSP